MKPEETQEMDEMYKEAQEWLKNIKVALVDGEDVIYQESWGEFKRKGELFDKEKEELN